MHQKVLIREELEAKMLEHFNRGDGDLAAVFQEGLNEQDASTWLVELQQLACFSAVLEIEDTTWMNFMSKRVRFGRLGDYEDEADQRKFLLRDVEEVIESLVADNHFVGAHALQQQLVELKNFENS